VRSSGQEQKVSWVGQHRLQEPRIAIFKVQASDICSLKLQRDVPPPSHLPPTFLPKAQRAERDINADIDGWMWMCWHHITRALADESFCVSDPVAGAGGAGLSINDSNFQACAGIIGA